LAKDLNIKIEGKVGSHSDNFTTDFLVFASPLLPMYHFLQLFPSTLLGDAVYFSQSLNHRTWFSISSAVVSLKKRSRAFRILGIGYCGDRMIPA